jgi:ABC-type transport system involved in multi-copper enzyme maturation permease subunit
MKTIATIVRFELRQRLARISTWVYFGVFFTLAVLCVLAAGGAIGGATVSFGTGGKVFIDSPAAIHTIATLIGLFGTSFVAAIAGQATYQDIDSGAAPLFFSLPIKKSEYLVGRLAGAFVVCTVIYAAIGVGLALAMKLPLLDPSRVGAAPGAIAYVKPYAVALMPNLFITIALFFALAALTRRMLPVYAGSVVLLLGYLIAVNLADDVENKTLTSILDPFGFIATDRITEYWTSAERNTRTVPLEGVLLYNRVAWSAVAAALLAFTFARFSLSERGKKAAKETRQEGVETGQGPAAASPVMLARPTLDFSGRAWLSVFGALVRLQWRETVKSVIFLVLVLAGVLFMGSTAPAVGRFFGTPTWPVTYNVLELLGGSFAVFIIAIITFYSGELVWRERDAKLAQMYDALPVPRALVLASKWCALLGVELVLLVIVFLSGIVLQTLKGYHHYELGLYARWLFGSRMVDLMLLTTLAMFIHVIANHKYVGHFVMVGYYGLALLLPRLGFEHKMYWPNSQPAWMYSDMNGFGQYVRPLFWFKAYWVCFALMLAVVANLFWVRGVDVGLRQRWKLARERLTKRSVALGGAGLAGFVAIGAFLYWNMDVLNRYRTKYEEDELTARYERTYKVTWDGAGQPRVTAVNVDAELFPNERRLTLRGTMDVENRTAAPVTRLFVGLPETAKVETLALGRGEKLASSEPELGVRVYELGKPLQPTEHAALQFALAYDNPGFTNGTDDRHIVQNGSFFNSGYLPVLGYNHNTELADDDVRRKHHLPERERMRDLDDPRGRGTNYASSDGDWIRFEATVGTSSDQIAIAPGYLIKQWTEGGRSYFRYAMDAPILNFYSFISARYAVKRDTWNGVAIEVYHHPPHDYDVDRMIRSVKSSLDYFTKEFGPYQHKQVRIIEFPRYESFAQSFPNTIPYSEAIGFIARVDDTNEDEIDYPFYVTSHEVAHQWWAHQVIGGDVQGSTMLSESFAQYSAFMVMKHTYGERAMRKFLRYELDSYLRGRGTEHKKEVPLVRVENQPYIHYAKGSLVMYALQDAIGEETVNRALRRFLEQTAFKGPPYANTRDFMAVLRREAPASAEPLLHDLFDAITLYELRATSATARQQADGKYEVTVKATAKKLYADEVGVETEAPLDEELGFGALDENGAALAVEKRRVNTSEMTVTFVVDRKPAKAGIDPLHMRIDRKPEDNVIAVEIVKDPAKG